MAIVTSVGLAIITNRIRGAGTEPNYLAWGTGATAEAAGDTALGIESAETRVACTTSQETTTVANDTYQAVGTLTSTSAQTISEVGLLDAATTGNLFLRDAFTGIALNNGESITFTIKVDFS